MGKRWASIGSFITSNPQAFVQFAMHAVMADHYRKNLAG
jgi:hypothetical protein